jgi:hypothetical protein
MVRQFSGSCTQTKRNLAKTLNMPRDEWYGPQFLRVIQKEVDRRLHRTGQEVVSKIKRNISTPTAGAGPSRPGGYPHADTHKLLEGVGYSVSGNTLTIYSMAPHTMHLEVGTVYMAPRPFLRRTVMGQMRGRISAILCSGF